MTVEDILDAINERLLVQWPDRTVYIDVCPVDFDRPSFWLAVEEHEQTDANRFFVRHALRLRLTLYDETDEHYDASWLRLARETETAMELLTPPLAAAGARVPLSVSSLPRDPDRAYVLLGASWLEKRPGLETGQTAPTADSYSLRIRADHGKEQIYGTS